MQQQRHNLAEFTKFSNEELKEQQKRFNNRKKSNGGDITEAGKAYLANLRKLPKESDKIGKILEDIVKTERRPQKDVKQTMQYEDAKKIVWRIIKERLKRENKVFAASDDELKIIVNLIKYFIGDPSSCYDLKKGIFIYGNTGLGKTFILEVFKTFLIHTNSRKPFLQKRTRDVYKEIALTKGKRTQSPQSVMKKYEKGEWFFDDLGDEPVFYKDFGNDVSFMIDILTDREDVFTKAGIMTHITSNLIPFDIKLPSGEIKKDEVLERYGKRLRSRFNKMFNFILWVGKDKR